jgi:hypothetical protein
MRTEFNALAAYLDTLALATGPGLFQSGSAALPGIAFAGDTDTGLLRPGANQIGIATAGVQRLLLTTAAFQVDLPITGTAVTQSATDATAGRLLKVGDFGLGVTGNTPLLANLDATDRPSGIYRTASPDTTGTYPTGANQFGVLMIVRYTADSFQQEYADILTSRRWRRHYRGAGSPQWSPWRLMYDQATAVGTVSQTGGVPTGALIETGSNANGEYVRLADGTQICQHRILGIDITTAFATNLFQSAAFSWTFPAAFVTGSTNGANVIGRIGTDSGISVNTALGNLTTAAGTIRAIAGASITGTSVFLTATGRWF